MNFVEVLVTEATALSVCFSMHLKAQVRYKIILQNDDGPARDRCLFFNHMPYFTVFPTSCWQFDEGWSVKVSTMIFKPKFAPTSSHSNDLMVCKASHSSFTSKGYKKCYNFVKHVRYIRGKGCEGITSGCSLSFILMNVMVSEDWRRTLTF